MASALSSYLHQKEPNKYGGQQEDYLKRSEAAIQGAVQTMHSQKDPAELFFKIFEDFRKERRTLADAHGTYAACNFGVLRRDVQVLSSVTELDGSYIEYNALFMEQLKKIMAGMKRDLTTFKGQKVCYKEKILGRNVSYEVQVLERSELAQLRWEELIDVEDVKKALETEKSLDEIAADCGLMKQLKKRDPELYQRVNMSCILFGLKETYPAPQLQKLDSGKVVYKGDLNNLRNRYLLGTLRFQISGKMYAMSRCVTWLYQGGKKDAIDRMVERSKVSIIHQDSFLADDTLQEISQMFKKAVLWDPKTESVRDLKNRVALLRFTYAHCMPCFRGDGAIGDWLELALYRFHGFDATRFRSDKLPCFEPLASLSLSHYLGRYDQVITVAKSGESKEEKKEKN